MVFVLKSKGELRIQACLEILKLAQQAQAERQIPFHLFTVPRQELSSAVLLLLVGFALLLSIEATLKHLVLHSVHP